jgi:hypothetical protein
MKIIDAEFTETKAPDLNYVRHEHVGQVPPPPGGFCYRCGQLFSGRAGTKLFWMWAIVFFFACGLVAALASC